MTAIPTIAPMATAAPGLAPWLRQALAAAACLAAAASASAAPPETVQTRGVETLTSVCCGDVTLNIQTAGGAGPFYQTNSWGQSWATVQADAAQFGRLAGQLSAGSQLPEGAYTASGGAARLRDAWSDLFTIGSSTLAAGTPVQLQLTVLLNVDMLAVDPDGAGSAGATGRAAAALHFGGWDAPWITGLDLHTGTGQAQSSLSGPFSQTAVVNATVGQTLHLVGDLSLNVNHSSSAQARLWSSAFTNAEAIYRVDLLTAGATVSTASGFSYGTPAPVPEPGTWLLMLAGLCAVAPRLRRRAT